MSLSVRPYQPGDRETLHQIGADTAFFGEPIENYMDDRRSFMDGFYAYYTDYEPEHAWVACDDNRVVGFLTGCTDTKVQERIMRRKIMPAVLWKWIRGHYHSGTKTWRYMRAVAGAVLRGEVPSADLSCYPAHLHINLLPDWRGKGLGRNLMEAYLDQLNHLGVPGVHLQTTSMNIIAVRLYEKVGFKLVAAKPTHMYAYLVDQPVENRVYAMNLTGGR